MVATASYMVDLKRIQSGPGSSRFVLRFELRFSSPKPIHTVRQFVGSNCFEPQKAIRIAALNCFEPLSNPTRHLRQLQGLVLAQLVLDTGIPVQTATISITNASSFLLFILLLVLLLCSPYYMTAQGVIFQKTDPPEAAPLLDLYLKVTKKIEEI